MPTHRPFTGVDRARKWYPCAKCGAPNAGRSHAALCLEHRAESRRAAKAKFYREDAAARAAVYRENRRQKVAAAKRVAQKRPLPVDDAIALYRAEKAKRADQVTAWYAEARRRLDAERAA